MNRDSRRKIRRWTFEAKVYNPGSANTISGWYPYNGIDRKQSTIIGNSNAANRERKSHIDQISATFPADQGFIVSVEAIGHETLSEDTYHMLRDKFSEVKVLEAALQAAAEALFAKEQFDEGIHPETIFMNLYQRGAKKVLTLAEPIPEEAAEPVLTSE